MEITGMCRYCGERIKWQELHAFWFHTSSYSERCYDTTGKFTGDRAEAFVQRIEDEYMPSGFDVAEESVCRNCGQAIYLRNQYRDSTSWFHSQTMASVCQPARFVGGPRKWAVAEPDNGKLYSQAEEYRRKLEALAQETYIEEIKFKKVKEPEPVNPFDHRPRRFRWEGQ